MTPDNERLTELEQLLVMSAAKCGFGPEHDLSIANSAKVVRQAGRWMGLTDPELRSMAGPDWHPVVAELFAALVRMVRPVFSDPERLPERPGEALLEGGANWGEAGNPRKPPSWPLYTSCRLTERGQQIARELMRRPATPRHGGG